MRFRKLPVEIEARQWDGTREGASNLCRWANDPPNAAADGEPWIDYTYTDEDGSVDLMCHTLEGPLTVSKGDWVIRGIQGEFYPCKPDVFNRTYEPITFESPSADCGNCAALRGALKRLFDAVVNGNDGEAMNVAQRALDGTKAQEKLVCCREFDKDGVCCNAPTPEPHRACTSETKP